MALPPLMASPTVETNVAWLLFFSYNQLGRLFFPFKFWTTHGINIKKIKN
jgi:hypothetical protein